MTMLLDEQQGQKAGKINKTALLWEWVQRMGVVKTHQINAWGVENQCNHPLRRCQEMAAELPPRLRRLTKEEIEARGWNTIEGAYVVCAGVNK